MNNEEMQSDNNEGNNDLPNQLGEQVPQVSPPTQEN